MERRELEDRIRASLQARADDVQPTPELWERVSARTTRRARWQLSGWVLSGVAAVAALVVGGVVLLGSPRGVEIAPEPDVVDTPTGTSTTPDAAPGAGGGVPTIVTTDGTSLFRIDPATGEVVQQYTPRTEEELSVEIRELAVRPADGSGVLTVATVVENEGMFDAEVVVFDASGERLERRTIAMGASAAELPPDVVWSQDGRYLMWAGSSGGAGPALWAYDWADRPADLLADEPFSATPPGASDDLFARGDVVDLREWTGDPDGRSVLLATTTTGGAHRIELTSEASDCGGATPCPRTFQAQVVDLGIEGGSAMDLGTLDSGATLALIARPGQPGGDAESATLELVAEPMSDVRSTLEIPELTDGTASPPDAWMAVAGDRVAVGFDARTAHLLTLTGELVEDLEVASTVPLPEGTAAAGMALAARQPSPSEAESGTASENPALDTQAVQAEDGLPAHVIAYDGADLRMVDRRTGTTVASWPRPDGEVPEAAPVDVVVHPSSTPADLELVTRWAVGEAETLVRTVVRDGEVVVDEPLPDDLQPTNQGSIAEMADSVPVFSPTGDWFAWLETPRGADGPARLRIVPWGPGPAGRSSSVDVPGDVVRPGALVDWAATPDGDVLTFRPMPGSGTTFDEPAAMVEYRPAGADPTVGQWSAVDLPGILFDAGSHRFEDGAERYIAFAGDDGVRYGLAEAPGSAVPTGAVAFGEGRVVAFGPDSALVQRADGAWQRVQVDDGATSAVEVPDGTVAILPWPAG